MTSFRRRTSRGRGDGHWLLIAAAAIGALVFVDIRWLRITDPTIVALSFLLVVVVIAAQSSLRVAIATSFLAVACFNFFFLPPVGTFAIAEPQNLFALLTLLIVSVFVSRLSTQARARALDAIERLQVVTERKEAELVRRSAELKSALLASLSHDLRTPLTAMTVAANNLSSAWMTAPLRQKQIALIQTELARLNRLFENLVDMARIDANSVATDQQWVQPDEIVDAARSQVGEIVRRHAVVIDRDSADLLVRIDPRLTATALARVLENAAQYSPPGTALEVCIRAAAGELRVTVRDHGSGIPSPDLDRVFDRFYRSPAAAQRFGTGMGLAIARGLLAAQGGRIQAENHGQRGALFTISVPVEIRPLNVLTEEGA